MLIGKECETDKEDGSCKDDQTSADAQEAGKATGAMSYAFTSKSKNRPEWSFLNMYVLNSNIAREPQPNLQPTLEQCSWYLAW